MRKTIICLSLVVPFLTMNCSKPASKAQEMCENMSPEMKQFSAKLNENNQMIFCTKFNEHQRDQAMKMSMKMGKEGTMMTPDQSVEMVAKEHNMMG